MRIDHNTQVSAQFGVEYFQRVEILLDAIDRTRGEYFQQHEGTGFYIERADFPVLLAFNTQASGVEKSLVAKDGFEGANCPFKGFTLTHPPLYTGAKLTMYLLKNGASLSNNLADPGTRMSVSSRNIVATAAQDSIGVYIPPGVRCMRNFQVTITSVATVTSATLQFYDKNGTLIQSPNLTQTIGGATVAYGSTFTLYGQPFINSGVGPAATITFPAFYIPTNAVEFQVVINGTGLVAGPQAFGNFE